MYRWSDNSICEKEKRKNIYYKTLFFKNINKYLKYKYKFKHMNINSIHIELKKIIHIYQLII